MKRTLSLAVLSLALGSPGVIAEGERFGPADPGVKDETQLDPKRPVEAEMQASVPDGFTAAAVIEILRGTNVSFGNLATTIFDPRFRSIGRRGLYRLFDQGVLERLALIALGRSAGFLLAEIKRMFAPDGRLRIDRKMLAAKADELGDTNRRLGAMRRGLRHAAVCPAPSHLECPTFRRLLALAR